MKLKEKLTSDSYSDLPDHYKDCYTQDGDVYYLDTDGSTSKTLDEFRKNNRVLFSEKEALTKSLRAAGIDPQSLDPEELKSALAAQNELDALHQKKLISEGKMEEVLADKLQKQKDVYLRQIADIESARDAARAECQTHQKSLGDHLLRKHVRQQLGKVGKLVSEEAFEDVMHRASNVFSINFDTSAPIAQDQNGDSLRDDTGDFVTIESWSKGLVESVPYLFTEGEGGGATGNPRRHTHTIASDQIGDNLAAVAAGKVSVS